jgi:hypothetical protein
MRAIINASVRNYYTVSEQTLDFYEDPDPTSPIEVQIYYKDQVNSTFNMFTMTLADLNIFDSTRFSDQ